MCLVKKPKVVAPTNTEKEAPILRNSYLDGIDPIIRSRSGGVRGLTIRRGSSGTVTVPKPQPATQVPISGGNTANIPTISRPISSGGGGGISSSLTSHNFHIK